MITRGHMIGDILDRLSDISNRVKSRCKLGLTDLNVHLENFYKNILNETFACSLVNLNTSRSNEPGLDLADEDNGLAFQITSVATAHKVNKTLKAMTKRQIKMYPKVYVCIIGDAQSSYTLDAEACRKTSFKRDQIIDTTEISKRLMSLELEPLHRLYDHVKRETQRIHFELEIPDEDGKYPSNLAQMAERIPKQQIGTGKKFLKFLKDEGLVEDHTKASIVAALEELSEALQRLPRITREFYVLMVQRREFERRGGFSETMWINFDKLERYMGTYDWHGELRILDQERLASYEEPDEPQQSAQIRLSLIGEAAEFQHEFITYLESNGISLEKPLVSLDFSDF